MPNHLCSVKVIIPVVVAARIVAIGMQLHALRYQPLDRPAHLALFHLNRAQLDQPLQRGGVEADALRDARQLDSEVTVIIGDAGDLHLDQQFLALSQPSGCFCHARYLARARGIEKALKIVPARTLLVDT